jgi:hypothetical protein
MRCLPNIAGKEAPDERGGEADGSSGATFSIRGSCRWLASQKSARTRRAYRLDVRHFMRSLGIGEIDQLRTVDHRAVIAWERMQREQEGAAASTVRRRLAALSSGRQPTRAQPGGGERWWAEAHPTFILCLTC